MLLKSYIIPILRYWWLIAVAAIVAAVSSYLVMRQQPAIYQTRTTMIIGRAVFEANPSSNDLWMSQQLANFYADIGMRGDVQTATMQALGLTWLPEYYVYPLQNSQLLEIVVTDTSPIRAQAVANELANQLIRRSPTNSEQGLEHQGFVIEQISYLEGKIRETLEEIDKAEKALTDMNSARQISDQQAEISSLQEKLSQLQSNYAALVSNTGQGAINTLTVIETAPLPTFPIGPNKKMIIAMAALVAMVIAAGAAFLLEYLDDTIKSSDEASSLLSVPVLANIPIIRQDEDEILARAAGSPSRLKTITQNLNSMLTARRKTDTENEVGPRNDDVFIYSSKYPHSTFSDEFRSLRINLEFAGVDKPLKCILITSASPGEGKTSVATNLAIITAQSGKKVILLDADFRKPSINMHFHIANRVGLSNIFRDNMDLFDVVQPWKDTALWIITTGTAPPNPVDLLSSHRMSQIIEQLSKACDLLIIDGPPLMFTDSVALSTKVDGVLMVMRHSNTRRGALLSGWKQLSQVGARITGLVMNKTPGRRVHYNSSYNYYNNIHHEKEMETEPKRLT